MAALFQCTFLDQSAVAWEWGLVAQKGCWTEGPRGQQTMDRHVECRAYGCGACCQSSPARVAQGTRRKPSSCSIPGRQLFLNAETTQKQHFLLLLSLPSLLTPSLGLACFVLFSIGGWPGRGFKSNGVEKTLDGPAYGYSVCN